MANVTTTPDQQPVVVVLPRLAVVSLLVGTWTQVALLLAGILLVLL